MKKYLLLISILFWSVSAFSQNRVYEKVQQARSSQVINSVENLFTIDQFNSVSYDESAFRTSTTQTQILLSQTALNNLLESNATFISVSIPVTSKIAFDLELIPINIFVITSRY